MTAGKVINIILAALIALGFASEAVIVPVIKKIKSKTLLSLDNLIYLIPFVLALNSLFVRQGKIITLEIASCYQVPKEIVATW